jgi:hypothetical protein
LAGTLVALMAVLVSAVEEQPEQMKTCTTVAGSARVERDHSISLLHFGQCGGSRSSSDFLSLSTMTCRFFSMAAQFSAGPLKSNLAGTAIQVWDCRLADCHSSIMWEPAHVRRSSCGPLV